MQALTNTAAAAGKPWWSETFGVASVCLKLLIAPLVIVDKILSVLVGAAFVSLFGAAFAWYCGLIPDEQVAKFLGELGDRGLAIIQASGVL